MSYGRPKAAIKGNKGRARGRNRQKQNGREVTGSPGVSLNAHLTNPSASPAFDALVVLTTREQLPKSSVKTMRNGKKAVFAVRKRIGGRVTAGGGRYDKDG